MVDHRPRSDAHGDRAQDRRALGRGQSPAHPAAGPRRRRWSTGRGADADGRAGGGALRGFRGGPSAGHEAGNRSRRGVRGQHRPDALANGLALRLAVSHRRSDQGRVAGPLHNAVGRYPEELNSTPCTLVWFRRDLRLADNAALAAAVARGGPIVPLFVLDPALIRGRDRRREAWGLASLRSLEAMLRAAGAGLVVRRGDPRRLVPSVAQETGADAVYWNRDYTPYARRRDEAVSRALAESNREVASFSDGVLVEPDALLTAAGRP